jgi:hypothetical protein
VEHSAVVVNAWPLDQIGGVDKQLGPKLDCLEGALRGHTVKFQDDIVAPDFVGRVDEEAAVVVGEVAVGGHQFGLDPTEEARFVRLHFDAASKTLAVYHIRENYLIIECAIIMLLDE